jgi:hypothetical protein
MRKVLASLLCLSLLASVQAQLPAFPGAEGFGKYAPGARASSSPSVYHVTNLNDAGSGSLRDAVSQPNRIIVFDVSGIIKLNSRLVFSSNLYVAGQTAPGDGVSVYGNGVSFSGANNIIVRYMRFRMGIKGDSGKDAAGVANGKNMIFDHCSFNWGLDETFSVSWDNKGSEPADITIQNSIIGQGIMTHSAGGLIQTNGGVTLYRNFYTDNKTRNPKVKGLNQYVNNVVYNWGSGGCYILGDTEGSSWADITDNYFIKGPSTGGTTAFNRSTPTFQVYQEGNKIDYSTDGVLNGRDAEATDYGTVTLVNNRSAFTGIPQLHRPIDGKMTAEEAYYWILDSVGASLPSRDEVDRYLIDELKSLGTRGALINSEAELGLVNGVGNVFNGSRQSDTDNDGIPDSWESAAGLNPSDPSDALLKHQSGYLNIERYIHSIRSPQPYVKYPTSFRAGKVDENYVILRWQNNETGATSIQVEQSADNKEFTLIKTLSADSISATITGLSKATTYYFRIKTQRGELSSLYTPTVKVMTIGADAPPVVCTDPVPAHEALLSEFSQVTLSWSNPSSASSLLYYNLYVGTSPGQLVQKTAGATASTYNLAITPGIKYYWRVDAMNILGLQTGDVWSFTTGYRPPKEKVAYFPLDETDGTTAANEIEGEATALNFAPLWQTGKVNNGVLFSSTPSNAALVQSHYDAISLDNESFTVEMWFKSAGGAVDWYLIHKGSHIKNTTTGATGKWFGIQYNKTGSNDRLTWAYDDDITKTDINATPGSAYFDSKWHHLVAVRDLEMKQARIYLDGVLKGTKADATTTGIGQTENLVIGNTNNPGAQPTNAFQGMIDEVSIYKGVLSESEIKASYNEGLISSNRLVYQQGIKLSPNPFRDILSIDAGAIKSDYTLTVSDLSGRVVYDEQGTNEGRILELHGLKNLPSGVYLLCIRSAEIQLLQKIVKIQ